MALRPRYGGSQNPQEIVRWWRARTDQIEGVTDAALEAFAETGERAMKEYIATDTKTRASAARGGGRIDKGKMIRAVGGGVTTSGTGRKTARFGWGAFTGKAAALYFLFQEGGFRHYRSGQHIEGMYAQERASHDAVAAFRKEMRIR